MYWRFDGQSLYLRYGERKEHDSRIQAKSKFVNLGPKIVFNLRSNLCASLSNPDQKIAAPRRPAPRKRNETAQLLRDLLEHLQ